MNDISLNAMAPSERHVLVRVQVLLVEHERVAHVQQCSDDLELGSNELQTLDQVFIQSVLQGKLQR